MKLGLGIGLTVGKRKKLPVDLLSNIAASQSGDLISVTYDSC